MFSGSALLILTGYIFYLESEDVAYVSWWFDQAKDILFLANPTDYLRKKVLKAPFIECIYSILDVPYLDIWHSVSFVPMLLSGLKTLVRLSFENLKTIIYNLPFAGVFQHRRILFPSSRSMGRNITQKTGQD